MQYSSLPGMKNRFHGSCRARSWYEVTSWKKAFTLLDDVWPWDVPRLTRATSTATATTNALSAHWVRERGVRDGVVIIGKGAHHNRDRRRVTPFDIDADIDDSLARFQFEYIDLYLLHRDDPDVPVGPIIEALNEHRDAGRIHAFGGSNWSVDRIDAANEYAAKHGLTPFVPAAPISAWPTR